MKTILLSIALMLPMPTGWAGQQLLATINDPPGDDYGAGTLVYPQRADFEAGDLDLLRMDVSRDEEGFWFEVIFKNPIRDPGRVADGDGIESLANFARKGFYQFNIDVYVDTDRVKGSGNVLTLPGRHLRIDAAYAWEKAVVLTPRPELMRQQLLAALAEQFPDRRKAEIEAGVDQSLFFATRILVRGKSISFFVPSSFVPGSDGSDWAVTALVTGAISRIPADLSLFPSTKKPLELLQLGVMQPAAGRPRETFGYSGAVASPVVDLLGSSAEQQVRQLAAKKRLTGVSWGSHAADDALMAVDVSALPAEQKPDGTAAAESAVPLGTLLQPERAGAERPTDAMPDSDPSIVRRMQILQQLFDRKLIDETEYRQQKQRILNDL